ncbi:MAG: NADPH-dependent FMN reductase [Nakamurella sp.]
MSVRIVGIGGSVDAGSQSDAALRAVLAGAERRGAGVQAFTGSGIDFPPYFTGVQIPAAAGDYIEAVRAADAVVISSPGYHGTISGLVKNALDYLEELRADRRPYLDGRAVGLVAVAAGWQATVNTLATLRQIAHTLRGWPTPYGLTLNTTVTRFAADLATDTDTSCSVDLMAAQLVDFASKMGTSGTRNPLP